MLIDKLNTLKKLIQDIVDDPFYYALDNDIQDTLEDLTFDLPMQITLLLKDTDNATINFTNTPGSSSE